MAFTVKYDGNFLTDHMRIIDVHRNLGAGIVSTTEENVFAGDDFVRSRRDKSTIEVEFRTFGNIATARRLLAQLTSSSIPTELIFSDEPNLYYQAIRQGEITLTESKSKLFATGTITFLVPSGEAVSVDTKVLNEANSGGELGTITHNADGSTKVIINNKGSLETFPKIKVTNVHENGYLGFVNPIGILELGKREEADRETVKESQILYTSDSDSQFSELIDATGHINPQNPEHIETGGLLGYQKDGLRLITPSTDIQHTFKGGMKVINLPPDSNGQVGAENFYMWWNVWCHALTWGETGVIQILMTDSADKFIAGWGIVKTNTNTNKAHVKFWIGGNNPKEYKSIQFTANDGEARKDNENNTSYNSKTGSADFVKKGASLGFYWKGSRQTINVPELEKVKVERVYIFMGDVINSKKYLGELSLRRLWFRKDYVSVWNDLPNRYQTGSVIELDMENGKLIKDGIAINNELVTGSKFFSFPPGESELDIYQSSWNTTPPQVEIEWKERYL